jgi:GNAT superfamily N-acetyltransferase
VRSGQRLLVHLPLHVIAADYNTAMHTIRLSGGWAVTPSDGMARYARRFGRPRTLDPNETVWVTIRDTPGPGTVAVNCRPIGDIVDSSAPFSVEIRSLLQDRNELVLELRTSGDHSPGDATLEIRTETLSLTPATPADYAFTHDLTRSNMERYVAKYWGGWDETVYRANFERTENLLLRLGDERVGFVRLEPAADTLVLEDVQLLPAYQNRGLGGWMLDRVRELAGARGVRAVRLRCFKDNPARRLYLRAGFRVVDDAGVAEWFERVC